MEALIVFSFDEGVARIRAKAVVHAVFHELSKVEKHQYYRPNLREIISFRAYLAPFNKLVITKRKRRAMLAKYRGDAKFSNAFKPKRIYVDEIRLYSVDVADSNVEFGD
ncbi:hypothetical protein [Methylomagnum ishizawai]|uniref:hypothetical protein n=1 Tax=Methylomagnum ishizawai TaxID=1760988 RepID=UPI001C337960|nr:hypothetical protein [Methylomagnum ishizawai]BBL74429.1 hypothetical protein MishRS11D_15270 [Methylomagnum ishizawai]